MLVLDSVSKAFGTTQALFPTSLTIEPGETTVLIGPSGCGKSTLLRLLVGLIWPDTGSIRFQEEALTEITVRALRKRIGYVIQEGGLFPHLTAKANVHLMASYLGWSEAEMQTRLAELAELVHLPLEAFDRFPSQLSGGQRQRVSLVRALMLDPDVLLLDEPLGALDPMIRASLQEDLKTIFQQLQKTVVLVTHDMSEAAFFGHRIVLLREGQIEQVGTFTDLIEAPATPFVEAFINAQRSPF